MTEPLQLDGHKLLYHLDRLQDWMEGKHISPLYVELGLTSACNQRCVHCYTKRLGYKPVFLDDSILSNLPEDLASAGVKALCLAGRGEPLLHKGAASVIRRVAAAGIDTALATNGTRLDGKTAETVLPHLTWVRFSMLGGSRESYRALQGGGKDDFDRVEANIARAVEIKRAQRLDVTIGVAYFLFRDNIMDLPAFSRRCRETGVDYLVVKPLGDYPQNDFFADKGLDNEEFSDLLEEVESKSDENTRIVVRRDMFSSWGEKTYGECLSLPFMTIIDSDGRLFGCGGYWQDDRYCLGDLHDGSFGDIRRSDKCRDTLEHMRKHVDFGECYNCCRNHTINRFLWSLRNPPDHVNFI